MNEEEFVKDFNRTIGKLEGFKLTEHKDLPNEADLFFRPVLEEEEIKGNLGKLSPKEGK